MLVFALVALFTITAAKPQVNVVEGVTPGPVNVVGGAPDPVQVVDGDSQVNIVDGARPAQTRDGE